MAAPVCGFPDAEHELFVQFRPSAWPWISIWTANETETATPTSLSSTQGVRGSGLSRFSAKSAGADAYAVARVCVHFGAACEASATATKGVA